MKVSEITQSCPTLCDPSDCSLPGSSVHGIFQARVLEWGAIAFSRGSYPLRTWPGSSALAGRFSTDWDMREAQIRPVCGLLIAVSILQLSDKHSVMLRILHLIITLSLFLNLLQTLHISKCSPHPFYTYFLLGIIRGPGDITVGKTDVTEWEIILVTTYLIRICYSECIKNSYNSATNNLI